MKISLFKSRGFLVSCFLVLFFCPMACTETEEPGELSPQDFDRGAMLENWADNIIIPAYEDYLSKVKIMDAAAASISEDPSLEHLTKLKTAWLNAYLAWQSVSMFEIGKSEQIGLRNYTNIYPTSADGIEKNIESGDYNLLLPSKYAEQGLPAIDYLINGLDVSDELILDKLKTPKYSAYLRDLTARLLTLTEEVVADWKGVFRTKFVQNKGSSATSSVDKVVNDYLLYYERDLRAGKIGIPAGVFSALPLPNTSEAFYSKNVSKQLLMASLTAVQNFFNGISFSGGSTGTSLKAYLDYLEAKKADENLSTAIDNQFNKAKSTAANLNDSFVEQIASDNSAMLNTYDELQKNVVLIKVDMMQALNIQVDYVDADGD